ncbi:MAG: hypothetical protein KDJ17_05575 [Hyphomicrobiaceae bacterium]|nr:hypothetical protein [Hyphomicrobiaceae bacterium]
MGRSTPLLIAACLLSLTGMYWCAANDLKFAINAVALAFAAVAIWAALLEGKNKSAAVAKTAPDWQAAAAQIKTATALSAFVYAWGGVAMFLCYELSALHWQHGWEYGSIMLLIAGGLYAFFRAMNKPGSPLVEPEALNRTMMLSALHGIAAAVALSWLVLSGKLATSKGDWAANAVFMAGGLAIIAICAITVRTHRALTQS